jgi:cold shock CspA family protein
MSTENTRANGTSTLDGTSSEVRESGTVARFNDALGYGFVRTGYGEVFVHYTGIRRTPAMSGPRGRKLDPGSRVSFVRRLDDRGRPQAHDVAVEV